MDQEAIESIRNEYPDVTPEQRAFLIALPEAGSITAAAKAVGINRDTPYGWLEREGGSNGQPGVGPFSDAFRRAKQQLADEYESNLYARARAEQGMPGVVAGIFMLKALRPDTYREDRTVRFEGRMLHGHLDLNALHPDDRRALLERLQNQIAQLPAGDEPP